MESKLIKEERKEFVISELLYFEVTKLGDGRQLYEGSLAELELLHIREKIKQARKVAVEQII
ncbi:Fur-regulated basic protein FbpA [Niallia taxi]|uniref:Fur-regulated basic protein FbpA n=1 Tax=Niallia taxi TaxID=2499688 RepID=UPI00300B63CD